MHKSEKNIEIGTDNNRTQSDNQIHVTLRKLGVLLLLLTFKIYSTHLTQHTSQAIDPLLYWCAETIEKEKSKRWKAYFQRQNQVL
uniref:Uncharacterized protein n=1 Tax=Phaseolus vulgaris TaxID=3885 RepID=V7B534_PHAVU|nr:hypothetical protein PHAVU_008G131200g [Phaseolus vulgaris]ESW12655.1 hypothetical protein PHAVU_008G131200g [Phaseolus vulgaris]